MRNKLMLIGGMCAFLVVTFLGYYFVFRDSSTETVQERPDTLWTCAMHPQIKMPDPGNCPICGMELVPLEVDEGGLIEGTLKLSERARRLAQVETSPVVRGKVHLDVSMYGQLELNESRVAHITSRTEGRIERLFLDFTGISVVKGDHMVELYSPELVTAQEELIQAAKAVREMRPEVSGFLKRSKEESLESSRQKLELWGLSAEQVKEIETFEEPEEILTINAPIGGVVIHKEAIEGRYVKEGTKIYTIADLSELWLILDAYESDLGWLRHGQEVEFKAEAMPGRIFTGRIAFIDPVLDEKKRSVRIRADVKNSDGLLKPGMFVRGSVKPVIGSEGSVISKDLEGKWISPMHPQVVTDEPGSCPICGMDLVTAESLGYVTEDSEEGKMPLLIPSTAPLITGKRAIVYVEDPKESGTYSARVVTLGPRAENYYIVYGGLHEGERVVTNGNFKIDSASQILAKPSMMSPEGGAKPMKGHSH